MSSVDVVVPCYLYGRFLRECVESILTQSGPTLRVLIIDDASPDDTAEVAGALVRADSRVSFRRHASNRGHIATYNEGIAWASAEYMALLSADDFLAPGALQRAAEFMDCHSSVGFTFGGAIALEDGKMRPLAVASELRRGTRVLPGLEFIKLGRARNIVLAPSVVVRTSLQKKIGGYLSELTHSGDMEMWLRFAAHGDVGFIDEIQAVYRRHPTNMSHGYSPEEDLLQRKAAFDHFLSACSAVIPNIHYLCIWLTRQLALDAIGCASRAFNEGNIELSARLSDLALDLDPRVGRSRRWWSLACKRRLGLRRWELIRPAVDRLRGLSASL
ncbi:glycosyltransferase family 2 protein [Bradyrhizobium sp. WSM1253]|uniref:glycosyltransferase family 2 protein n=1 Tax=Bradyrhizobium sp. WSM1253 TaxID=319003 RepID=UPI00025D1421|nr:glycosyltransferase family 2 protein [Bradyrhizobium sp. WSM1253]EIG57068.1 glycosyl transferase [Bradyrhizobium sp. WSM1253]